VLILPGLRVEAKSAGWGGGTGETGALGPGKPGPYRRSGRGLSRRLRRGLGGDSRLGLDLRGGRRCGLFGFGGGGEAVVVVGVYGGADGFAPAVGAESVDVLMLGDVDGLQLGLEHVGDGAGESGLYIAADYGGDEASEGSAEIAGGKIVAGEEAGEVFAECFCSLRLSFFFGVVEAEVGMTGGARCATAAAIFESEQT